MSKHVVAIRPPDERWLRMKAAHDALVAAGLPITRELDNFFDGHEPDPEGVILPLDPDYVSCVREWSDEFMRDGLEVILSELPPDVKIIRFYNSY
jgi:hypothetical protein